MSKFYNLEGQSVVVEATMTEIIQEGFIDKIKSVVKNIGQKLGVVKKDFKWTEQQFKDYCDTCLKDKDFIKEMDETLKTVQYNLNFMAKDVEDDECKLEIKLCSYTQAIRDLEKCENKYAEVKKGPKALTVINRSSSIPEEYYLYPTKFKNYCLLFIGNDVESLEIIVVITQRNKVIKDDVADIYGYSIFAEMSGTANKRIRELFGIKESMEIAEEGWFTVFQTVLQGVQRSFVGGVEKIQAFDAKFQDMLTDKFNKVLENDVVKNHIKAEADKLFAEEKKSHKKLVKDVSDASTLEKEFDAEAKGQVKAYSVKKATHYLLRKSGKVGEYTVILLADPDSKKALKIKVVFFDPAENKYITRDIAAPNA